MADSQPKNIVVVGGGIIGCTTAYFLTRHPSYNPATHKITILEASTVAGGASGKAGGLLALWAYPSNIVPLSYKLHAELAKEHGGESRWGYRRIHCGQVEAKARPVNEKSTNGKKNGEHVSLQKRDDSALKKLRDAGFPKELDWVAPECAKGYAEMGDPDTTAQVHPFQFTTVMAALAKEAGVDIVEHAKVESIDRAGEKGKRESVESVTWVNSEGKKETTTADTVVLSAGPWTKRLLPSAPIGGLRAHSVTIKPSTPVSAYALFTEIELARGMAVSPEIYARPDEVYACGDGDTLVPLPETTANVKVDDNRCQDIVDYVGSISDELRDGEVTARQACYLPVSRGGAHGGPFIGEVRECKGLVLATGHSCWGIQNAPGTGKCVSELIMDGKVSSAKLGQYDAAKSI